MPIIIGIGGGTGSGKSTFCHLLEERLTGLSVEIIHMDRYYKETLPRMISPVTGDEDGDWNHPDALDICVPLARIQSLIAAGNPGVVLVEGAFLLCYDEFRRLLDLKIFIDIDADERMYRRFMRNMRDYGMNPEEVANYYLHFAKHRENEFALNTKVYADLILNDVRADSAAMDVLVAWIKGRVDSA